VAAEQGVKYASVGAGILSVLTEPKWFKGSLDDMKDVRVATEGLGLGSPGGSGSGLRPAVLRKDFVIDEYQILEARAFGADTVLLIVAILEVDRLQTLIRWDQPAMTYRGELFDAWPLCPAVGPAGRRGSGAWSRWWR
jgi:indole-3-glycerol phosphate synthase